MQSYINIPQNTDFSIHNLPFGVYTTENEPIKRIGVAIGEQILALQFCQNMDFFYDLDFDKTYFIEKI